MRLVLCAALISAACSGSSSSSSGTAAGATRFLPADPELAFHIDLMRVRAWSGYAELAPLALKSVEMLLADAKERCGLDVIGTATAVTVAKKGPLMAGDLTLVVEGLPRAQVTECVTKVAAAKSALALTVEGDVFLANVAGRSVASGAILPTGEVVIVARAGAGVPLADWKTEVARGASSPPKWWGEFTMRTNVPVVVRTVDELRTTIATATLDGGLTVKGMLTAKDAAGGERDARLLSAVLNYLEQGNAGKGKVEAKGAVTYGEITARGPAMSTLIKTGGAALFGRSVNVATKATTGPISCDVLADAVQTYMKEALSVTAPERQQEMAQVVARVLPELTKTYVDACTNDKWDPDVIKCHVDFAQNLPKFEKCQEQLPEEPRTRFNTAVGTVLAKEK